MLSNDEVYANLEKRIDSLIRSNELSNLDAEKVLQRFKRTFIDRHPFDSKVRNDEVFKYVFMYYPEVFSLMDVVKSPTPLIKFIWTFNKDDEIEVDKIFNNLILPTEKLDIEIDDNWIILRIVKIPYESYDLNASNLANESYTKTREKGYEPFNILKKRMIPHGMIWLNYNPLDKSINSDCIARPVRSLAIEKNNYDGGWREDLQYAFRSSWEANIARILNKKKIKWTYEPDFIDLDISKLKKGIITTCYLPDFVLEDNSIIEVKGYWDKRSLIKMKLFQEQNPDRKIVFIDGDIYRCLEKKYSEIIDQWEIRNVNSPANDKIDVVGITIPDRAPYVLKLEPNDELLLIRDANNPFDKNAIKVTNLDGNHIGFVSGEWAKVLAPKMDMGFKYSVTIKEKQLKVLQCMTKLENPDDIILPDVFS